MHDIQQQHGATYQVQTCPPSGREGVFGFIVCGL